ncbi:hypothetical protein BCR43DRAFT_500003 [Syncephalastrum racemosum]|uniref:DUF7719 domain-containing protein n=1 Tax=Syncephalastrum racemosum TaxID=13706 RepID=A0A1X2GZ86_SYNRA|nr:hypothetical protein BCR43DRAFT_500003 [Syncephalastrum racemosum]
MAKDASKSKPLIQQIPESSKKDTISEEEKERLLRQSGLLKRVKKREAELQTTTAQYVWQAIFMTIPFGFLLGAFDITVKVQYSEPWSYLDMLTRALRSAPALFPVIYLTNRHKEARLTQTMMALCSILVGSFLMYTLRHSPSLGQMMRAPGLATIWVYFVVQLDLLPAVVTLAAVGIYYYFGLRK